MSIKDITVDAKVDELKMKYNTLALRVAVDIYNALPHKTKDDGNIYTVNDFWLEVIEKLK